MDKASIASILEQSWQHLEVIVVNYLPSGIRDIVTRGIGNKCSANNSVEFANIIETLSSDRKKLS